MAMSKKTVYSLFIAKFVFSLAMIFWTIKMTLGAGVGTDDDNTFMSYYKDIDKNYNEIAIENYKFAALYDIKVKVNDFELSELDYKDVYLSQRVIKDRSTRKSILHVGKNEIAVQVYDKKTGKLIESAASDVVLTMPSSHKFDKHVKITDNKPASVDVEQKSYWNIMGIITANGMNGRFYIKTNAI